MKKFLCLTLTLILVTSTLLLVGCGKSGKSSEKMVINEVAHSIFYAPMYVALAEGYFEEEGLEIELVTGFGADKTMTAILSGEADIGLLGPEATIYTYAGNPDDYVVNIAQLTKRAGNFLVARGEVPDFSWEDLKGTTVLGGRKGGMPEMVFEYILKKNNIDPMADLTIDQSIDFGSTSAAFSSGKGDYTVEFEPAATALELMGEDYHVIASLGVDSGYVPYTCFAVKSSYIAKNPEKITKFIAALKKGCEFVESHTDEEIAKSMASYFKETDMNTLTKIVSRYHEQDSWNTELTFKEESFQLLKDILDSAGELPEDVPYAAIVNTEFTK